MIFMALPVHRFGKYMNDIYGFTYTSIWEIYWQFLFNSPCIVFFPIFGFFSCCFFPHLLSRSCSQLKQLASSSQEAAAAAASAAASSSQEAVCVKHLLLLFWFSVGLSIALCKFPTTSFPSASSTPSKSP